MDLANLQPSAQAVLRAVAEVGPATAAELVDKTGKSKSTVDRAVKVLVEAGLIVPADPDADEGAPARWVLSEVAADELHPGDFHKANATDDAVVDDTDAADSAQEPDSDGIEPSENHAEAEGDGTSDSSGGIEPTDGQDTDSVGSTGVDASATGTAPSSSAGARRQNPRFADRRVMSVKGVLAEFGDDGATLDQIVAETGMSHPTASRLLDAMERVDAARRKPDDTRRWVPGPTKASEVDPDPKPPRCPLCTQVIRGTTTMPASIAALLALADPDGTLSIIGSDGEIHTIKLSKGTPPLAPRATSTGARSNTAGANGDGNQPFARGELERLTLAVLEAAPGRPMTPQDVATVISAQHGRAVSSGAVRNNCTKLAAAGRLVLVAETPLTFLFPKAQTSEPSVDDEAGNAGQANEDDEPPAETEQS
ncbi:MarR family transcriptional regulator [Actinoplanes sp. NPDC023714]|uniref:MarR family transcriptional regulator n=1 Tax=Actinoplanes sp. NPDC023714 TaxID=3154322 RepID=UPI0033E6F687